MKKIFLACYFFFLLFSLFGVSVNAESSAVKKIEITKEPADAFGSVGEYVKLECEANGENLTYRWYYRNPGSKTWTQSSSAKEEKIWNLKIWGDYVYGQTFKCVVTDEQGNSGETREVKVSARTSKVTITKEPADAFGSVGEYVKLECEASGENLTYRWYYRNPGSKTWTQSSSAKEEKIWNLKIWGDYVYGQTFKCVVTDEQGNSAETKTVVVKEIVIPTISITVMPEADSGYELQNGESLTIRAEVNNASNISWQRSDDGQTYTDISSADGNEYIYTNSPAPLESQTVYFRAVATSSTGNTAVSNVIEVLLLSEDELPIRPQSDLMGSNSVENSESKTVSETPAAEAGATDSETADKMEDKSVSSAENNDTGLAEDFTSENNTETQTEKETGSEPEAESETQDMTADVSAEAQ